MFQRHSCYHYTIPDLYIHILAFPPKRRKKEREAQYSVKRPQKAQALWGKKICAHQDLPSGKKRDGFFLQAGLAVFTFRRKELLPAQIKTSLRLSSPAAGKAVCLLGAKKICAHQDLPSGKKRDGFFLQAGLAVFTFRRKELLPAQIKTSLRLSSPAAGKAVCLLGAKKICAHQDLNLKPADYESAALTN